MTDLQFKRADGSQEDGYSGGTVVDARICQLVLTLHLGSGGCVGWCGGWCVYVGGGGG